MQTASCNELQLSTALRERLQRGETLAIQDDGRTIAFLVPAQPPGMPRPLGLATGKFTVPDDFNDNCPEIEGMFYGMGV